MTINGIKKHVGILERADLVVTEKVGRARQCRLSLGNLDEATAWMEEHRRAWESRLDRFERYVERTSGGGGVSLDLRFERLIAAAPERVFDAFTDPAGQREFYGKDTPDGSSTRAATCASAASGRCRSARRPTSSTTTATCSR